MVECLFLTQNFSNMVTVIDYYTKQTEDSTYNALILEGEPEFVTSPKTGMPYARASKCHVYSALSEEQCKAIIGKTFPGNIEKVKCEPYEYTVPETGEVLELDYSYQFVPVNSPKENPKNGAEAA